MILTLPGCKRKQADAGSNISPAARPETDQEDEQEEAEVIERLNDEDSIRALGPVVFDDEKPDAGAGAGGTRNNEEAQAGLDKEAEAKRAAEEKEQKDLADTEKAVNGALNKVLPQLRKCYESGGSGASSSTVSLRVHRRGYVIGSNVDGANRAVSACIQQLLGNIKVQGVKTDTITVKRKFSFRQRTKFSSGLARRRRAGRAPPRPRSRSSPGGNRCGRLAGN